MFPFGVKYVCGRGMDGEKERRKERRISFKGRK